MMYMCRQLFHKVSTTFCGAILLAVCVVIITAGLWPFDFFPINKVSWLYDRNGVNFYGQGMIFSPALWGKQQKSPFQDAGNPIY